MEFNVPSLVNIKKVCRETIRETDSKQNQNAPRSLLVLTNKSWGQNRAM
uniref:Cisplatin resistance-associated overexpressed protein n=1 Tax=Rhizophora mucronata TaxID=61149 RepID=A0A2P2KR74_RHIMU